MLEAPQLVFEDCATPPRHHLHPYPIHSVPILGRECCPWRVRSAGSRDPCLHVSTQMPSKGADPMRTEQYRPCRCLGLPAWWGRV